MRGFYCRDYYVRLDSEKRVVEQTAGASVEEGENRDDPPVPWLSEGWLSQSCVVSKWHEHLSFKYH